MDEHHPPELLAAAVSVGAPPVSRAAVRALARLATASAAGQRRVAASPACLEALVSAIGARDFSTAVGALDALGALCRCNHCWDWSLDAWATIFATWVDHYRISGADISFEGSIDDAYAVLPAFAAALCQLGVPPAVVADAIAHVRARIRLDPSIAPFVVHMTGYRRADGPASSPTPADNAASSAASPAAAAACSPPRGAATAAASSTTSDLLSQLTDRASDFFNAPRNTVAFETPGALEALTDALVPPLGSGGAGEQIAAAAAAALTTLSEQPTAALARRLTEQRLLDCLAGAVTTRGRPAASAAGAAAAIAAALQYAAAGSGSHTASAAARGRGDAILSAFMGPARLQGLLRAAIEAAERAAALVSAAAAASFDNGAFSPQQQAAAAAERPPAERLLTFVLKNSQQAVTALFQDPDCLETLSDAFMVGGPAAGAASLAVLAAIGGCRATTLLPTLLVPLDGASGSGRGGGIATSQFLRFRPPQAAGRHRDGSQQQIAERLPGWEQPAESTAVLAARSAAAARPWLLTGLAETVHARGPAAPEAFCALYLLATTVRRDVRGQYVHYYAPASLLHGAPAAGEFVSRSAAALGGLGSALAEPSWAPFALEALSFAAAAAAAGVNGGGGANGAVSGLKWAHALQPEGALEAAFALALRIPRKPRSSSPSGDDTNWAARIATTGLAAAARFLADPFPNPAEWEDEGAGDNGFLPPLPGDDFAFEAAAAAAAGGGGGGGFNVGGALAGPWAGNNALPGMLPSWADRVEALLDDVAILAADLAMFIAKGGSSGNAAARALRAVAAWGPEARQTVLDACAPLLRGGSMCGDDASSHHRDSATSGNKSNATADPATAAAAGAAAAKRVYTFLKGEGVRASEATIRRLEARAAELASLRAKIAELEAIPVSLREAIVGFAGTVRGS